VRGEEDLEAEWELRMLRGPRSEDSTHPLRSYQDTRLQLERERSVMAQASFPLPLCPPPPTLCRVRDPCRRQVEPVEQTNDSRAQVNQSTRRKKPSSKGIKSEN